MESVSTDTLTLNFALPSGQAPGAGVNVGIPITYLPANQGHPSLTIWSYLSGGAIEMISGARVTGYSITADAGQLINGSFSLEGTSFFWNPRLVEATTSYLDFTDDDGTFAIQLEQKYYKDPGQLATAITTAMNSSGTTQTHACTFDDVNGRYIISTSTSTVLSLLWNTGTNAANTIGGVLGFDTAADDTGSTSYTADNQQTYDAPFTPVYDAVDPIAAKNQQVMLGLSGDNVCFEASSLSIGPTSTKSNIQSICAETGISSSIISAQACEISVTALLDKHQQKEFQRFRENQTVEFQYSYGPKADGSNWDAGKSGAISTPSAVISAINVINIDDIARLELTLTCFSENGEGHLFFNFV